MKNAKFCCLLLLIFIIQTLCFPQTDLDYFIKSKVEESYNKVDSSIFLASKAISLKPKSIYYIQRANLYLKNNDYNKAITDFTKASENNNANYQIAKCYAFLQNWEQTALWLRKYLSGKNKIPSNVIKTDTSFLKFKNNLLWTEIWKNNWYSDYENYIADIYNLNAKGFNSDIYDLIDSALKHYPQKDELWLWRAKAFELGNNPKEALLSLDKAIKCNPNRADILALRANILEKNGKNKKAITDLSNALNIEPWNMQLLKQLGITKIEITDFNGAIDDLLKYQSFYYNDANSLYFAGHAAYLNNDLPKAIEIFTKALNIDGSNSDCYFERGRCYLDKTNYNTAFSDFCMAIDLNPNKGEYFYYRGLTFFDLKNNIGACSDWEKAKNLNYLQAEQYMLRICSEIKN